MINRILIITCLIALFIILALNVIPLFWGANAYSTYIRLDEISGMAVRHENRLFTLNFEQQKQSIEILNRSIPVGKVDHQSDRPLEFDQIVIYRFKDSPIVITPVAWSDDESLYFQAPVWSQGYLKEVSKGELYRLLGDSYDRKPYH